MPRANLAQGLAIFHSQSGIGGVPGVDLPFCLAKETFLKQRTSVLIWTPVLKILVRTLENKLVHSYVQEQTSLAGVSLYM